METKIQRKTQRERVQTDWWKQRYRERRREREREREREYKLTGVQLVQVVQRPLAVHAAEDEDVGAAGHHGVSGARARGRPLALNADPGVALQVQHVQVVVEGGAGHAAVQEYLGAHRRHGVAVARLGRVASHRQHRPGLGARVEAVHLAVPDRVGPGVAAAVDDELVADGGGGVVGPRGGSGAGGRRGQRGPGARRRVQDLHVVHVARLVGAAEDVDAVRVAGGDEGGVLVAGPQPRAVHRIPRARVQVQHVRLAEGPAGVGAPDDVDPARVARGLAAHVDGRVTHAQGRALPRRRHHVPPAGIGAGVQLQERVQLHGGLGD